jgi:hypothetical protein
VVDSRETVVACCFSGVIFHAFLKDSFVRFCCISNSAERQELEESETDVRSEMPSSVQLEALIGPTHQSTQGRSASQ